MNQNDSRIPEEFRIFPYCSGDGIIEFAATIDIVYYGSLSVFVTFALQEKWFGQMKILIFSSNFIDCGLVCLILTKKETETNIHELQIYRFIQKIKSWSESVYQN